MSEYAPRQYSLMDTLNGLGLTLRDIGEEKRQSYRLDRERRRLHRPLRLRELLPHQGGRDPSIQGLDKTP